MDGECTNAVSRHCNTSTVLSAQVLEQAMALQAEALQEAQAARIAAEMLEVSPLDCHLCPIRRGSVPSH